MCGPTADVFIDHPISMTINSQKYYYLYDGLGSVTEVINSDEEVVNRYRYSPFGDTLESLSSFQFSIETSSLEPLEKNEQVYNPYQYTGRRYDEESGLYYYRARMYSPEMSRFTSNDPAKQGENWYTYVGNNPTNNRDPSGKWMPMSIFDPRPYIPYMQHGIEQYAYYPTSELGLGYHEYGGYSGYDIAGNLVDYLFIEEDEPGIHKIQVNGFTYGQKIVLNNENTNLLCKATQYGSGVGTIIAYAAGVTITAGIASAIIALNLEICLCADLGGFMVFYTFGSLLTGTCKWGS